MPKPTLHVASGDLLTKLWFIMRNGLAFTAEDRHQYLLEVFQAAGPAQIDALLGESDRLALASNFVHAVLDDLDERRFAAAAELHDVLGLAAPVIVGWPE